MDTPPITSTNHSPSSNGVRYLSRRASSRKYSQAINTLRIHGEIVSRVFRSCAARISAKRLNSRPFGAVLWRNAPDERPLSDSKTAPAVNSFLYGICVLPRSRSEGHARDVAVPGGWAKRSRDDLVAFGFPEDERIDAKTAGKLVVCDLPLKLPIR
ncbi:hypothetical protein J2Y63_002464 [Shinella sp. BE166]